MSNSTDRERKSYWDDPHHLWSEVDLGAKQRDAWLSGIDSQIARMTGGRWANGAATREPEGEIDPENPIYEHMATWIAEIGGACPRAYIESDHPQAQATEIDLVRDALEYCLRLPAINATGVIRQAKQDALFGFGVLRMTVSPMRGLFPGQKDGKQPDVAWLPRMYRYSPRSYAQDALAETPEAVMFRALRRVRLVEDIIAASEAGEEEGWNIKRLESLRGTGGSGRDRMRVTDRGEIAYYDVYVPGFDLPESEGPSKGYNGTWFTLAEGLPDEWLRDPYPAYGPVGGSISVYDFYGIPDSALGLAPFMAGESSMRDLGDQGRLLNRALARQKVIALVAKGERQLAETIAHAADGSVHIAGVDDLANKVKEVQLGAKVEARLATRDIARQRVEILMGMPASSRGQVSGVGTATEEMHAMQGYERRMGFPKQRMGECDEATLRIFAWYLYHGYVDEKGRQRVRMPLPPSKSRPEGIGYEAGSTGGVLGFDNLRLRIQPYSMRVYTREEKIQQQLMVQDFYARLAQLPPYVDKARLERMFAQANDMPELIGTYNAEEEREMMMQQGGEWAGQPAPPPAFSARLTQNSGVAGLSRGSTGRRQERASGMNGRTQVPMIAGT
jgi:hypothetical protein